MDMIKVIVNGLPGKMATKAVEHVLMCDDLELLPISLTGPETRQQILETGGRRYKLIKPEERSKIRDDLFPHKPFISVDFTHPSAVNPNTDYYCENMLPFVMGTTGGDRKRLEESIRGSQTCAVIAPNMAKQIVAFQAMMSYAAQNFPGVFRGYQLSIRESHQKGKADTSGTARVMVGYFNALGIPFTPEQIVMERDPKKQRAMGIPEEYLAGHGWHTYTLTSEDGTVFFKFEHNVNGREIYAAGTIDAIRYLNRKVAEGNKGMAYSMIDVLKGT